MVAKVKKPVFILLLILLTFFIYKVTTVSPPTLNPDNVLSIVAHVPINGKYQSFDVTREDSAAIIRAYNESTYVNDTGAIDGFTIELTIYTNEGGNIKLVEDSLKTVQVSNIGKKEGQKKIRAPWIAQYIRNLRKVHNATW